MSQYIKAKGINYLGALEKIKKKDSDYLQPIYEAFTNALESIKLLKLEHESSETENIEINLFVTKTLIKENYDFCKIEIKDTGIGFNDTEFNRLVDLNDQGKGFANKGTGRVQFLHSFNETKVVSVYKDNNSTTGYKRRIFTISKSISFVNNNAIIRLEDGNEEEIQADVSSTNLLFKGVLTDSDKIQFENLTIELIKKSIVSHYIDLFCENRDSLPKIAIRQFINDKLNQELEITSIDIPEVDKEESINVSYSVIGEDGSVTESNNKETFNLKAFKISENKLENNALKLVSKGEIAKSINLDSLSSTDQIENSRYLFLLSGKYIDDRDDDTRGEIKILTKKEFQKRGKELFYAEEILLENIEIETNNTILNMYDEIRDKKQEKNDNIDKLKEMFLFSEKTLKSLKEKVKISDTDEIILKKVYEADAKRVAKNDAKIKKQIQDLDELDPSNGESYDDKLREKINSLVKIIPLQNRTALTRYVARRKIVLELFEKIINKELKVQNSGDRNINESLLHNLIFKQTSKDSENSDLWLVNEDFIYFKGTSEVSLGNISLGDDTILKDNLSEEEDEYRLKQEGDAQQKRPDILLFPKEGKCIIIELKSPDTKVSNHLNQINRYASLINNLSKDQFRFTTYYGYLIGENIDVDDIQDNDSDFVPAHNLGFIYRPYKRIIGKFGKDDGSLYTEVIKYSTLLKRALVRNKIFIDKMMKQENSTE